MNELIYISQNIFKPSLIFLTLWVTITAMLIISNR